MAKDKPSDNYGAPPAYPPPIHQDAGPAPVSSNSPYNAYGGLKNSSRSPPSQAGFDPRGAPPPGQGYGYASPPPAGGYMSPGPGGPGAYGPPGPQQGYYGPPQGPPQQGMYYGPPQGQGMYPPGPPQGYRAHSQYERDRGRKNDGICAGILGALACCCCLDILF